MRPVPMVLALLALITPVSAEGQDPGGPLRDAEVGNYPLSMGKIRKLVPVQRSLNALAASNPQVFETLDSETDAQMAKKGRTLTMEEGAALLDRHPEFREVFTAAGMTSKDWLLTSTAMAMAMLAHGVKTGELHPETTPPPSTAAEKGNLALWEQNLAECKKIEQELEQLREDPAWQAAWE